MAEIKERTSGMFISDEVLNEYRTVLEGEQFLTKYEASLDADRAKRSRASAMKSSRFLVLRMRRGLPFKSPR
jgi:hypothetical protein